MSETIVTLKKGEGRTVKSGGAWIFDNEIASMVGSFSNGDLVLVHDFDGYLRDENGQLKDYHYIFSYWKKWMPLEKRFEDLSELGDEAFQEGKK